MTKTFLSKNGHYLSWIAIALLFGSAVVFGWDYLKFRSLFLPLVIIVAALWFFNQERMERKKFPIYTVSLLLVGGIYVFIPDILFDDAGFVIRYLNNFWDGHWFKYNVQDPPVFGISSFLYGLVSGVFCYWRFMLPEDTMATIAVVSIFFCSVLIYRIIDFLVKQKSLVILFWALCFLANSYFLSASHRGLETAFHNAIVLWAAYLFVTKRDKWLGLALALCIVSKYDAVPLVGVFGLAYLVRMLRLSGFKDGLRHLLRTFIPQFGGTLVVFLGYIYLLFGSLLPQSAAAKLSFHKASHTHWFPFIEPLLENNAYVLLLLAFCVLFVLTLFSLYWIEKEKKEESLVFGFAFLGTLVLYYLYNPNERMMWYYPLPLFMMLLQIVISIDVLVETWKGPQPLMQKSLLLLGLAMCCIEPMKKDLLWSIDFVKKTESERFGIGLDIGKWTDKEDTVSATHGLPVAHTDAYVLDLSGLNQKLVTDYKRKFDSIIQDYPPNFHVSHVDDHLISILNQQGNYRVRSSYYSFSRFNYPPIMLFERVDDGLKNEFTTFRPPCISGIDEGSRFNEGPHMLYLGKKVTFSCVKFPGTIFTCGVDRFPDDYMLTIQELKGETVLQENHVLIPNIDPNANLDQVWPVRYEPKNPSTTELRLMCSSNDWTTLHIHYPLLQTPSY